MLCFPLRNLVLSPLPVTNYWKCHKNSPFPLQSNCNGSNYTKQKKKASILLHVSSSDSPSTQQGKGGKEEYQVVSSIRSEYNDILILDTPNARMLLLDSTHNVHSILNKDDNKWTESYWDEFTSLPAIIPKGPIAILGLGGGTAAHLMLDLWPSLQLEGWEIDPILIDKARQYFGLSELEKHNKAGGILHIHIKDALSSSGNDSGRYAGIIVDLFYEGKVLPQLEEVETWLKLNDRLMEGGRLMVNCGGINEISNYSIVRPKSVDDNWAKNSALKALSEAFPGQVSWKRLPDTQGANYLGLTGPVPDLRLWSSNLPHPLSENVMKWRPCATIP